MLQLQSILAAKHKICNRTSQGRFFCGHGIRDKIFIHYLYGRPFTVRTDDNALKWLLSFKELKGQVGWRCLERMII